MTSPAGRESAPLGRDLAPVLVLLSADWAGPSRPAPTLLRELSRRWGAAMHTLLLEDPDDELLDRWEVEHLPTWLRFVPDDGDAEGDPRAPGGDLRGPRTDDATAAEPVISRPAEGTVLREAVLSGRAPGGEKITLPGPWRLSHRRSGALPKHAVEAELGPSVP